MTGTEIAIIVAVYMLMGHCLYMWTEFIAKENGYLIGWIILLFLWAPFVLLVGIGRTFYKILS